MIAQAKTEHERFTDFVVALVALFPPQLVEVDVVNGYSSRDEGKRAPLCIVRMESPYTRRIDIQIECQDELQAQILAIRTRRAVDAVSTFGIV